MRIFPVLLVIGATALGRAAVPGAGPKGPGAPAPVKALPAPAEERVSDIPPAEKVRRCTAAIERVRQVHKEVAAKLEEARTAKDVVKLNCVNDKATHVKGLLRVSEQAFVNLTTAISKKESISVTPADTARLFLNTTAAAARRKITGRWRPT